jgi:hypothetical protein
MAAKKKTKKKVRQPSDRKRAESAWRRLSHDDRVGVTVEWAKKPRAPGAYERGIKKVAGQPGAYVTRKGGTVRNARKKRR